MFLMLKNNPTIILADVGIYSIGSSLAEKALLIEKQQTEKRRLVELENQKKQADGKKFILALSLY